MIVLEYRRDGGVVYRVAGKRRRARTLHGRPAQATESTRSSGAAKRRRAGSEPHASTWDAPVEGESGERASHDEGLVLFQPPTNSGP